jgi:hypothetical protein
MKYPLLTGEQLSELESRLIAAELEVLEAYNRGMTSLVKGPATLDLEFKALEYIRRLLEDVKACRSRAT